MHVANMFMRVSIGACAKNRYICGKIRNTTNEDVIENSEMGCHTLFRHFSACSGYVAVGACVGHAPHGDKGGPDRCPR